MKVPFVSIRTNRGIEQENRALKVLNGTKVIANSSRNLDEYFLPSSEISKIFAVLCNHFDISVDQVSTFRIKKQYLQKK